MVKIVEYWTCHQTRLEVYDNQPDKFVYLGYHSSRVRPQPSGWGYEAVEILSN